MDTRCWRSRLFRPRGSRWRSPVNFHIVFAALGVGLPLPFLIVEYRANRAGDAKWTALARREANALAILFAVGAVSGNMLSARVGGRRGTILPLAVTRDRVRP